MSKSKKYSGEKWSPPKNSTMSFSLLILVLGIYLGIGGYFHEFPADLIPISIDSNILLIFIGLALPFLSWLILYIGIKSKAL